MRRRAILAFLFLGALGLTALWWWPRSAPLPADLKGALVFVSDRAGTDALFLRRLPRGEDQRLTFASEPVEEPAFSPDGTRVAFSMGGRIGVVSLPGGDVRILTLGIDWRDRGPAWRPDGKGLVVVARGRKPTTASCTFSRSTRGTGRWCAPPSRRAAVSLTSHPGSHPTARSSSRFARTTSSGSSLADGRASRVTSGFRKYRSPRFLPSGRLLALWTQEKQFGIDVMDPDGRNRETLSQGTALYRSGAPSPDGRYLAASFSYDLEFHPAEALKLRKTQEVRLLDAQGRALGPLVRSWSQSNHSPDWGP